MPSAVQSVFDIALWFDDTAEHSREYLQPQKLHRLLFLSQAYFAIAYNGRKLMPAVFIADEQGPIEPNIYRAFAKGRPNIEGELFIPQEVEIFLESIWRRFGSQSADRLAPMSSETQAYKQAFRKAPKTEITLQAMRLSFTQDRAAPGVDQIIRPKIMRTQSGKPVAIQAWKPKPAKSEKPVHSSKSSKLNLPDNADIDFDPDSGADSTWASPPKRLGGRPWPPVGKR